jgi:hypothetical protein
MAIAQNARVPRDYQEPGFLCPDACMLVPSSLRY